MDAIAEIKHLYHNTTRTTIQRDLTRAVTLLKTLATEEERERVAVYMDGLSQMRSEWGVRPAAGAASTAPAKAAGTRASAAPGSKTKRR
jgi:hypothetical protein